VRILLIEDYQPLLASLTQGLEEAGFVVDASADGEEGLWFATKNVYDAVILDVMLPSLDGLGVLRRMRAAGSTCQVLMLTARDSIDDRVRGLDLGADDYLVKPFAFAELLARLRALIRRAYGSKETILRIGDLEIDTAARTATRAGEHISLTAREYALLEVLARRSGELVTRSDLWDHCYDFLNESTSNVIDVYIGYLRKKIERPGLARLIHTRRGQGYMLKADG
jgi:two-component system copper resistance phosphate regulon response regulator CusR